MVFISNTGKQKLVKSKDTGRIITIPSGTKSFRDDPVLEIVVGNNKDLKFISKDEFLKSKDRTPVKKKIETEVKERAAAEQKKAEAAKKAAERKKKAAEKKKTEEKSEK